MPQIELENFSELKSILGTQPQNGVWIIPQLATVNVIPREDNLIELELVPDEK